MIEILNGVVETVVYKGMNSLLIYDNDTCEDYPIHWHTAMELIMPVSGEYTAEINGVKYQIKENEIFIIPPGELHTLYAPETGRRYIMLFDYTMLCNLKNMDSLLHIFSPFKHINKSTYNEEYDKLFNLLKEIIKEYNDATPYSEASIFSLFLNFFIIIGRSNYSNVSSMLSTTTRKNHEHYEKYLTVCNYINEHCTDDISVYELADIAGFSRFHFARLFKQFSGISYNEYLIQKRIEHAEKLFINPEISITEVAMQSGFNSLSTFNRIFKSIKNCTPSEYRQLNNPHNKNM